jgi:hypothetical protein
MLAVEGKCSRICGADAQLSDLDSMLAHKIHCVLLKFLADTYASHFLDQVKEIYISMAWFLEDLQLHLSDDLIAMPSVNASIGKFINTQPKPLDVVHAIGSLFIEEAILTKAAYIRVAPKLDTH